ncbi:MAG: hypothetical protein D8M52_00030 [Chlorobi bacterium]|nr:MAG: hypothetical protein F9K21_14910 [Rhodocyclaceae bacterium]KXK34259.1 MAG: hypothetical protein UZ06_CHB003001216 [Chlorobi bacterium OLB6]MBL1160090.1 hypothetical protein [Chlorobiota bacterium]MBW7840887.1 hypothetical protein [Chitinophagaceae bacterium]MBZ0195505.1 hypothetical protein [Candidatus Kapabacteria bacterium]MCL4276014.1 hypothetical protein [Ignavibacteria bacterium]
MNGSRIKGGLLPAKIFFSGSNQQIQSDISATTTISLPNSQIDTSSGILGDWETKFGFFIELYPDYSIDGACIFHFKLYSTVDPTVVAKAGTIGSQVIQYYLYLLIDGQNNDDVLMQYGSIGSDSREWEIGGKMISGVFRVMEPEKWEIVSDSASKRIWKYIGSGLGSIKISACDGMKHKITLVSHEIHIYTDVHNQYLQTKLYDYYVSSNTIEIECPPNCSFVVSASVWPCRGANQSKLPLESPVALCCDYCFTLQYQNGDEACIGGWRFRNSGKKGGMLAQGRHPDGSVKLNPALPSGILICIRKFGTFIDEMELYDRCGNLVKVQPFELYCPEDTIIMHDNQ